MLIDGYCRYKIKYTQTSGCECETFMRIVHIATSTAGGAGIAARRLNASLNLVGINSVLITGSSSFNMLKRNEIRIQKSVSKRLLSKVLTLIQRWVIQNDKFLITSISLPVLDLALVKQENPDVIHIHSAYNLLNSRKILELCDLGKPVFLTLHDQRFFTGGCHQSFDCVNYKNDCSECPYVKRTFMPLPMKELASMKEGYGRKPNLAVIAPSKWIFEKAKVSSTLGQSPITKIYNSIDQIYVQDIPAQIKRPSSFIITFVAQDLFNEYKGIDTLLKCMKIYKKDFIKQDIKFQFVGDGERIIDQELIYKQLSRISESKMREIYLNSDLLIVPSFADNSPNIIFEALACGVPFVGSDWGGIPELCTIFGMETFKHGDSASMYMAIIQQKSKKTDRSHLRKKALSLVHPEIVAKLHLELYKLKLISAN